MLKRANRLHKTDIEAIFKAGKFFRVPGLAIRFKKNNLELSRFGFVVSGKELKKAVERNLVKRRAREIIRKNISDIKKGYDVLFIFSKDVKKDSFSIFAARLTRALKDSKII